MSKPSVLPARLHTGQTKPQGWNWVTTNLKVQMQRKGKVCKVCNCVFGCVGSVVAVQLLVNLTETSLSTNWWPTWSPSTQVPFEHQRQKKKKKKSNLYECFSLVFPSAVHTIAHLFNFERFESAQREENNTSLAHVLSLIGNKNNESYLNPIRTKETVSITPHTHTSIPCVT